MGYGGIQEYSPYEVREYGLRNGTVYLARDIFEKDSIKRVFLARLASGKMTLYFYKGPDVKKFYVEIDSGKLIPLSRKRNNPGEPDYREKLSELTSDCRRLQESAVLTTYKQVSLASFVDAYNKCEDRDFPYRKFGFYFGYINTALTIPAGVNPEFLNGTSIETDGSMTAGIFLENPAGRRGLSLHYELQFARNNFNYYTYKIKQIWMVINTSRISLPVMVRYTAPVANSIVRPYINAGGHVSFTIQNESKVMEDVMDGPVILSETIYSADLLANMYLGYDTGAGLQFNVYRRLNLYTEFRYSGSYPIDNSRLLGKREWCLLTGISF